MKKSIIDYFDFQKANTLLEGFSKSTGFVTAILDLDGNILYKSGWREICTAFHRKNYETSSLCIFSDTELASQIRKDEKYHYYKCANGLIDVGLPIVVRGEHVANFFSGQFFFEEPDISFFIKQAQKYGFDEQSYIEALKEVPVVSKEKVETVIHFLVNITQMIIEMAVEKYELAELNEELKSSQASLMVTQEELDRNLKDLNDSQRIAHVGTWRLKMATNQVFWTEELYRMHGFDPALPPPPYTELMTLFTPESWERLSASIDLIKRTGTPFELELETLTKEGSNGWMWVFGEAEKDQNGNITSLWGIARDISGRKKREELLRQSLRENIFKSELLQKAPVIAAFHDKEQNIVWANQAYEEATGLSLQDIVGKKCYSIWNLSGPCLGCPVLEAIATGENSEAELTPQNQDHWPESQGNWLSKASPIRNEEGSIIGAIEVAIEITERKKIEKELKQSEERFQLLFNKAPLGYQSLDFNGCFVEVNQKWLDTLGYSREEVIGKWFGDFLCPEDVEGFRRRFPLFKSQGHIHSEFEMLRKDGQRIFVSFEGKIAYSADGEFKQTHCILQDITDQRMAERALVESEERFRVAQEISPDGFTILHPVRNEAGEIIDFTWVYENKAIAIINQTDPQKIIGKRLLDLFPDHRGTTIFEAYKHVAETGETQIFDEINVGEIISRPTCLRLVVVSMGEEIAIHTQDITERKAAEKTSEENVFRFQSLFNEMSAGAVIYKVLNDGQYGRDYIIQDFNKAALKAEGKEKEEVLGKSLYDLRPKIDEYGLIPVFQRVWKTGEPAYYPTKIYIDEKFSNWYENRVYKLPSGEIVAIFDDVTDKSLAEESVRKQNDLFASLLKILPVGVFMVDSEDGKPLVVNETGKALLGRGILPDASEHNLSEVYKAYKGDTLIQYPANEMPITLGMKGIKSHIDDMVVERPDGSRLLLEIFGTPVNDAQGKPWASLVTFMDITDRKKAENELLYLSYHDHLTGLYNRRYFEQELKNLDTPENLPLSIIMFDVNGLKLVNDSFGHDLGDVLLKKSAEVIKEACRKEDIIARIGGDEFVILLPKTTAAESLQISNQIKELASNEKVANLEVSISYGYDTKKTENQSIIEIIANAENHMYRHKLYERSSIRSKITDLIMNTLFEKSSREAAHSNKVSRICQSIASKLDMGKDAVNKMKIAGLIHDIGKIGVDEGILNKPGSLTTEERGYIERHPEIGWRLLSSTDEFSELAKYVLSHHENWDGTGYPNGLQGEAIPLEARIISVADAYDAMTSLRSYQNKRSKEEAVKELMRCSGTQFDPEIVDVFVNQVLTDENFR